jgi:Conjugal transfer protein
MQFISRALVALACALFVTVAAGSAAQVLPHRALPFGYPAGGNLIGNGIVEYPADGRVLAVGCNPRALCQFIFPAGTKITAKALQDAHDWAVPDTTFGPDQRAIVVVKSKSPDALAGKVVRTQLVVLTSGSTWPFTISLYTSPRAPVDGTRISFVDRSGQRVIARQPALPRPRPVATASPTPAVAPNVSPSPAPSVQPSPAATPAPDPVATPAAMACTARAPMPYTITGDADFRPIQAFDDTAGHTCIVLPQTVQDAPVVYSDRGDGEETINYHTWAQGLFVDGTPNALVLRDGAGKGSSRVYVRKGARARHRHFLFVPL